VHSISCRRKSGGISTLGRLCTSNDNERFLWYTLFTSFIIVGRFIGEKSKWPTRPNTTGYPCEECWHCHSVVVLVSGLSLTSSASLIVGSSIIVYAHCDSTFAANQRFAVTQIYTDRHNNSIDKLLDDNSSADAGVERVGPPCSDSCNDLWWR